MTAIKAKRLARIKRLLPQLRRVEVEVKRIRKNLEWVHWELKKHTP